MRDIKFRQWTGERFIYWGFGIDGSIFAGPCNANGKYPTSEQYTGFKDSEGKEIYENSIINNKYIVSYSAPKYILTDISNCDIIREIKEVQDEQGLKLTGNAHEI
jgi:hypothetical protein